MRIAAPLFIMAFFAALPLWFLSGRDGWVTLHCEGAGPEWHCKVEKYNLLSTTSGVYAPRRITRGEKIVTWKRRSSTEYTLQLDGYDVIESRPDRAELDGLVSQLEQAKAEGRTVDRTLQPIFVFWFAAALVVVFAACGLIIALGGQRKPER